MKYRKSSMGRLIGGTIVCYQITIINNSYKVTLTQEPIRTSD